MTETPHDGPRYLTCAETAKLLRVALRDAFPGVKFSVRSHTYSGGASIHVGWVDGPAAPTVDKVAGAFAGGRFDGMTDLAYGATHWACPVHGPRTAAIYGNSYDAETVGRGVGNGPVLSRCCARAELVRFGSDYVFTSRELTAAARGALEALTARMEGEPDYEANRYVNGQWMSHWFHRYAHPAEITTNPDGTLSINTADGYAGSIERIVTEAGTGAPVLIIADDNRRPVPGASR